jgi:hypothetical protein
MMIKRKIGFVALLFFATSLVQNVSATLISSHYDGSTFYNTDDGLYGRIDFAVYDDRAEYEYRYGLSAPGTGDYIYAYQIFHDAGVNPAVAYFAILGIAGAPVDGIDSQDDSTGGIASSDEYFTDSRGVWEFQSELGEGILLAGEHSWFLVLSSDTDWVKGDFEIKPAEPWIPVPEIPEPCTLALFGLGGAIMLLRRKKLIQ